MRLAREGRLEDGEAIAEADGTSGDGPDGEPRGLDGAYLRGASSAGVDWFAGRSVIGAALTGADTAGADFAGGTLEGAILTNADLRRATLEDARLYETAPTDVHIRGGTTMGGVTSTTGRTRRRS